MATTTTPPAIGAHVAGGLTVLFTILYVAPFYLSATLRSNSLADRNTPSVIRARIRAVYWSCLASVAITVSVLAVKGHVTSPKILHLLGLYPVNVIGTFKSCSLVAILFAGPLFERGIIEKGWKTWGKWSIIKETVYDDLIGWRNYVVGPASEELVFRSLAISLFLLAKTPALRITLTSPLIFGLAHLHHLHEWINYNRRYQMSYISTALTPSILLPGLFRSLFQFLYTSLFGFIAAFIYLRTGSLCACILSHTFCNWMGLPRFWGRVGQDLGDEVSDVMTDQQEHEHNVSENLQAGAPGQSLSILWTVAYYIVLFAGAVGFWKLRWVLTESSMALAKF